MVSMHAKWELIGCGREGDELRQAVGRPGGIGWSWIVDLVYLGILVLSQVAVQVVHRQQCVDVVPGHDSNTKTFGYMAGPEHPNWRSGTMASNFTWLLGSSSGPSQHLEPFLPQAIIQSIHSAAVPGFTTLFASTQHQSLSARQSTCSLHAEPAPAPPAPDSRCVLQQGSDCVGVVCGLAALKGDLWGCV